MTTLLEALGGRSDVLATIDFETFYDAKYSLKKMTTESYVRDPRFETIGVGVKLGGRPSVWMEDADFRRWAGGVDWSRVSVLAHHAHFEGLVLSHHYGIRPRVWLDTLSMGRALHGTEVGGSLAKLATKYQVGTKGDEVLKVVGKRRRDFTAAEWLTYGAYCNNDVELTARLLREMAKGFPVPELWLIDMTVRMFTEPTFHGNQAVLAEALKAEKVMKRDVLTRVALTAGAEVKPGADPLEAARKVLSSSDKFAALLRSMGEEPAMKPGKKGPIYAFAKSDAPMQALLEHPNDEIRVLAEARLAVKSTIIETRVERFIQMGRRGRLPVYLKYSGAHTHRWAGGDKSNWQNMNRGGALRAAVEAPEGDTIAVADSGQIEARVVAWLAGEQELLETFRRNDAKTARYQAAFAERVAALGHDPSKAEEKQINADLAAQGIEEGDFYSDVGGSFFGMKLSKKETPVQRQLSKNMVLGLGFGMGWAKFSTELLKGMLGSPPVQFGPKEVDLYRVDVATFERRPWGLQPKAKPGEPPPKPVTCGDRVQELIKNGARLPYAQLLIHCAVTDYFVRLYRQRNPRITKLWEAMANVLEVMERPDGDPHAVRLQFGPLKVIRHGLVKPSGLVMRYPNLRRKGSDYRYQGGNSGREWKKAYGGSMTENVVQSLARDIVAEQALWVRADGYRIGTTTHDEIVAVPRAADGAACLARMLARMKTPPAWCKDLPLNADGGVARSYGEAK